MLELIELELRGVLLVKATTELDVRTEELSVVEESSGVIDVIGVALETDESDVADAVMVDAPPS